MAQKTLTQLYASHTGKVSDKWSSYLVEYDRLFNPYRNQPINLLEIGIQNGGSIEIWATYFEKAKNIIGCDINPDCESLKYDDPRISVVVGDANSTETYQEITKIHKEFDLIIDDGSHTSGDIIKSFIRYFSSIRNGGLFIAEDLHCSYWQQYEGGLYDPYSAISFFKLLTDAINHEHWGVDKQQLDLFKGFIEKYNLEEFDNFLNQVHSITFINSICVIRKSEARKNLLKKRFVTGIKEDVIKNIYKLHGSEPSAQTQKNNSWSTRLQTPYEELPFRLKELSDKTEQINLLDNIVKENALIEASLTKKIKELEDQYSELIQNEVNLNQNIETIKLELTQSLNHSSKISAELKGTQLEKSKVSSQLHQAETLVNNIINDKRKQKVFTNIAPKFTIACLFSKSKRQLTNDKKEMLATGLFSPLYYLTHNPDVAQAGINPLNHFLRTGWKEGRNPSTDFDCQFYLKNNLDVKRAGVNPLVHYLKHGKDEGRRPKKDANKYGSIELDKDISDSIRNYFETHRKGDLSENVYLYLYGALFPRKEVSNKEHDYQITGIKAKILEKHLISWDVEKKKNRVNNLVSIIILAYGQSELTDDCLKSILNSNDETEYEIILINNSQLESDITSIDKWGKQPLIKIVHNPENLNFALGCNLGFIKSVGDKIVFLNNDTTVTDHWLSTLLQPLNNQNISLTQPRLLYPDGSLQCMGLVFSNKSNLAYPLYQGDAPNDLLNHNRLFNAITGACIGVRAKDFSLVNGFDVSFINGQEDVDFCLRLNSLKKSKAMYVHNSIVYHFEGKSAGRGKFVSSNRKKFLSCYNGKISQDDYLHYQRDNITIEEWKLDSPDFKKLKVENYIPAVNYKNMNTSSNSPEAIEEFYIEGQLRHVVNNKTIVIAAHAVAKELFGGERSFLDMVGAVDKNKYNIIILLPDNSNEQYINLLKELSTCIYIVSYLMWNNSGENKKIIGLLENIYIENAVDLVYVNTIMCREPLFAARNTNIPTIIHVREAITHDSVLAKKIPFETTSEILTEVVSSSDFLITNSKFTHSMFNNKNNSLLYNRIDTPAYKQLNNIIKEEIVFGIISSNVPKKGIFDFVDIAKSCLSKIPNARFLLIGPKQSHTNKVEKEIKKFKLTNLEVAGYFESPIKAIQECNVILNLSHFAESFGRTVGEALAGGRPVIAYRHGAIPELIENGKSGFLVEYKNKSEVISCIEKYCDNPELITIMGEHGRDKISKISSPKVYSENLNNILSTSLNKVDTKYSYPDITIIIPIFNAYDAVTHCIDSVLSTTAHLNIKLILLDDASTDHRIQVVLKKYVRLSMVDVISNKQNKGYTKTINIGIQLSKKLDVILLNSDTIVTSGWVESLTKVAYLNDRTGTVTAMSDNAGAFSFPTQGRPNPKPKAMPHHNYAELITAASCKLPPIEVPTGSGFCIYIKRELFDDIGYFDEELFPRGYGEENDFCMRAIASGWKNVISPNTFVFHIRTASFGNEKEKLVNEAMKKVTNRYPNYMMDVKTAFNSPEMNALRRTIQNEIDKLNEIMKS